GRQPARPGSGLECQPSASLPSGQRSAGAVAPVRCEQTARGCAIRRDLRPGGQPTRSADATRRRGDGQADRCDPHSARQTVRLGQIDGRIRGLKVHVVFDPKADYPSILDITDANVNDAQIGRTITIEPGASYVFDKGYCHYGWWAAIAEKGAVFITRPKTNMRLDIVGERPIARAQGDGFTVLEDSEVRLGAFAPVAMEATGETDSLPEESGFEPLVPAT